MNKSKSSKKLTAKQRVIIPGSIHKFPKVALTPTPTQKVVLDRLALVEESPKNLEIGSFKAGGYDKDGVFWLPPPDPRARPLVPTPSHPLPSGGGFVRDPEIGAGEEAHRDRMESIMLLSGNW